MLHRRKEIGFQISPKALLLLVGVAGLFYDPWELIHTQKGLLSVDIN